MNGNRQMVPVDYFFNNDLKYLQGGISTMTYTTSLTKTKAAQYDLPGIEDMVPNIWVPVKVAYDKHALWGISHWREQRKTFYGYAQGLQSRHDVYSTQRILAVTQVEEGDFPRLRINDIEDMLLLVVQNRLKNLLGDDVSDFAIALRMFTRSLGLRMEYLPKKKRSRLDKRRARVMIYNIDKLLFKRRLLRNLEKFVGGREYGNDLRLLERTI
ncbi:hypothetical protein Tco_1421804 [Tanacetum coccineum]